MNLWQHQYTPHILQDKIFFPSFEQNERLKKGGFIIIIIKNTTTIKQYIVKPIAHNNQLVWVGQTYFFLLI